MSLVHTVNKVLSHAFPDSQINITDTQGTGYHLEIHIASPAFSGKTRVTQHQMVYKVLKDQIDDGTLHAVTLKTQEL